MKPRVNESERSSSHQLRKSSVYFSCAVLFEASSVITSGFPMSYIAMCSLTEIL